MKTLICASEAVPFAKTGGLADVAGALPKALAARGHDVRVILPKYRQVDPSRTPMEPALRGLSVQVGGQTFSFDLYESRAIPGVMTYLVDCPPLFDRDSLYGQPDDARRFTFFCRAVLDSLPRLGWIPDIIHCNDWQTALVPVYLSTLLRDKAPYQDISTAYTVHNLAYQGVFDRAAFDETGLPPEMFGIDGLEFYGNMNLMKAGILFAEVITTVSPTYAKEIQTPQFGERLEGVLAKRSGDLYGILNGIDTDIWDPARDEALAHRYDAASLDSKQLNKTALQGRCRLPARNVPVIGIISRLAAQKGFDILAEALADILRFDLQFVVLGVGEEPYHRLFTDYARRFPERLSANLTFDDELARLIYAGCDMFLMPSRFEPCGLGQMISLRYGTVPVVRATGGLADTVFEFDRAAEKGNGFVFQEYSAVSLLGAVSRALVLYQDGEMWRVLQRNAMSCDFSWERSADEYVNVYQAGVAKREMVGVR